MNNTRNPVRRCVVITDRYFRSHGKLPRGPGLWLFETASGDVVVEVNASYGVAKAHAIAQGKLAGRSLLYVCP